MILMKKGKNTLEKIISKTAYVAAKRNADSTCTYFFYQSELPEKVKKLGKYNA